MLFVYIYQEEYSQMSDRTTYVCAYVVQNKAECAVSIVDDSKRTLAITFKIQNFRIRLNRV